MMGEVFEPLPPMWESRMAFLAIAAIQEVNQQMEACSLCHSFKYIICKTFTLSTVPLKY